MGFINKMTVYAKNNKSSIYVGAGLVLEFVISNAITVGSTLLAKKAVDEKKKELDVEKLTFKQTAKVVWKYTIPPLLTNVVAGTLIVKGHKGTLKEKALIATAYGAATANFENYKRKVVRTLGSEKEKEIRSISTANANNQEANILISQSCKVKWFEPLTGRYFMSTWHDITNAADRLNARARIGMCGIITETDWFEEIGLSITEVSDRYGWDISDGFILDIDASSMLDENNIPCGKIIYYSLPREI